MAGYSQTINMDKSNHAQQKQQMIFLSKWEEKKGKEKERKKIGKKDRGRRRKKINTIFKYLRAHCRCFNTTSATGQLC